MGPPQKQIDFQNNIDIEILLELEQRLTLCSTEKYMINQNTIDILIENWCNIFITSGQKTLGTYNVKEKKTGMVLLKKKINTGLF